MNKYTYKGLPDKLSDLIVAACDDIQALRRTKKLRAKFKLNMGTWYEGYGKGKCEICMAGACMVKRLKMKPGEWVGYSQQKWKLYAINDARIGCIQSAVNYLSQKQLSTSELTAVAEASNIIKSDLSYKRDRGRAKISTYRRAVKILAASGL